MIFEPLYESANRGELILIKGGFCHWHLKKDGDITMREIIVLPAYQKKGVGTKILNYLKNVKGANSITARCPADLPANKWYEKKRFKLADNVISKTGRKINVWKYEIKEYEKS